jgi:hypothetical protein
MHKKIGKIVLQRETLHTLTSSMLMEVKGAGRPCDTFYCSNKACMTLAANHCTNVCSDICSSF